MKLTALALSIFILSFLIFPCELSAVGKANGSEIIESESSFSQKIKSFFKHQKTQLKEKYLSLNKWAEAKSQGMRDKVKRWKNLWLWGWILGGLFVIVGTVLAFVGVGITSATTFSVAAGLLILGSLGIVVGTIALVVFLVKKSE